MTEPLSLNRRDDGDEDGPPQNMTLGRMLDLPRGTVSTPERTLDRLLNLADHKAVAAGRAHRTISPKAANLTPGDIPLRNLTVLGEAFVERRSAMTLTCSVTRSRSVTIEWTVTRGFELTSCTNGKEKTEPRKLTTLEMTQVCGALKAYIRKEKPTGALKTGLQRFVKSLEGATKPKTVRPR